MYKKTLETKLDTVLICCKHNRGILISRLRQALQSNKNNGRLFQWFLQGIILFCCSESFIKAEELRRAGWYSFFYQSPSCSGRGFRGRPLNRLRSCGCRHPEESASQVCSTGDGGRRRWGYLEPAQGGSRGGKKYLEARRTHTGHGQTEQRRGK